MHSINGWSSTLTCHHRENGPWSAYVWGHIYYAQAEARGGNVAQSATKFAWLINKGLESDNDGLADGVEKLVCTDAHPGTEQLARLLATSRRVL